MTSKISILIKNTLANASGTILQPILHIILVPFYIHYLGLEGYGLVGFFSALTIMLSVFTKGLSVSIQREFAIRIGKDHMRPSIRRFHFTMEIFYYIIGIALGIILLSTSGLIASRWLKLETIPFEVIRWCVMIISLRIALVFPCSVYTSALYGLQRHVLMNVITIGYTSLSAGLGVIAILLTRSVVAFYASDLIAVIIYILALRYYADKVLPPRQKSFPSRFDLNEIKKIGRIAGGLIWTYGINIITRQADRIIISCLLPLAMLGVYSAGVAGAQLLTLSCLPFLIAVYPQTCQLAMEKNEEGYAAHMFRNSKVMMIIALSCGLPISFFAPEILQVWTHNKVIVEEGSVVMALYMFGSIAFALADTLHRGQVALGIMRYGVIFNSFLLLWYPVLIWVLINRYGLVGGAAAWLVNCVSYWIYQILVHHAAVVKSNSKLIEYIKAIFVFGAVGLTVTYVSHYMANLLFPQHIWLRLTFAVLAAGIIFIIGVLVGFGFRVPKEIFFSLTKLVYSSRGNLDQ